MEQLARWLAAPNDRRAVHPGAEVTREAFSEALLERGDLAALQRANALDFLNPRILHDPGSAVLSNRHGNDDGEGQELLRTAGTLDGGRRRNPRQETDPVEDGGAD